MNYALLIQQIGLEEMRQDKNLSISKDLLNDNFGTVVLICSLSAAVESRSGPLMLLLAIIDFHRTIDMQISLPKELIFGGVQGSEKLLTALKTEATHVRDKAVPVLSTVCPSPDVQSFPSSSLRAKRILRLILIILLKYSCSKYPSQQFLFKKVGSNPIQKNILSYKHCLIFDFLPLFVGFLLCPEGY